MLSLAQLKPYAQASTWWIAYSGGVDSTALLHQLSVLVSQMPCAPTLKAIHINHGLQADSGSWQQHCQRVAAQLHVECVVLKADDGPGAGDSIEAWARAVRYRLLSEHCQPGDVVFSAHHQDDQVETLLLQLSRGAGPYGLAAMPAQRELGHAVLVRPLLAVSRSDIEAYAERHDLSWIDDPSNQQARFDRNFIRHNIMPLLQQRWPAINKTLARSTQWMQHSVLLLDELAALDLKRVQSMHNGRALSIAALKQLSVERCQHVLRYFFRQRHMPVPTDRQMQQLMQQMLRSSPQAQPVIHWSHHEKSVTLRRYRDDLVLFDCNLPNRFHQQDLSWDLSCPLILTDQVSIEASDLFTANFLSQHAEVGVRWLPGGDGVKKLFQAQGVPPWWRYLMPVCYVNGERVRQLSYIKILAQLQGC